MTVDTVGDETDRNPVFGQRTADATRRSVREWRHRVVKVSRHLRSSVNTRGEFLQGRVGVTKTNLDPSMPQATNPFQTTRSLRRKSHQPQPAAFQQLVEQPPVGPFDRGSRMRSLSLWRKEWSFEMKSQRV